MIRVLLTFIYCWILFSSCQNKGGHLDQLSGAKGLYSVIIIKDDKVIFSEFYNGKTEKDLVNIQSETKSIIAILVGIAIDQGFIKNLDQPVSDFFPQILSDNDTQKKDITIRHLLNQTSGLKDFEYPKLEIWLNNENPCNLIITQPLISQPGKNYQYNTAATHLLSAIISKATHLSTEDFAKKNLFEPLGIKNYRWGKLKDGYNDGGGLSLWMKTTDMASIGLLLLHNGELNNRQIVSKQWLKQLFNKADKSKTNWGLTNSLHGCCWYSAMYKGYKVNYAMGYGGQFIFIIPGLNAVVAVNHDHDTSEGIEQSVTFCHKYMPIVFNNIKN